MDLGIRCVPCPLPAASHLFPRRFVLVTRLTALGSRLPVPLPAASCHLHAARFLGSRLAALPSALGSAPRFQPSQSARPSLVGKRSCSAFRTFRATSDNRCGRPTERHAPAPSVIFARQSRDQIAYAARRALIRLASSGRRFCFAI